ncbi:MAG: Ig-like domain-containing protein, partial [Gemmatimonadaceae bacterium]
MNFPRYATPTRFSSAWYQRVFSRSLAIALLATAACNSDTRSITSISAPNVVVRIITGDKQLGIAGDKLQPIIAQVTDLKGTALKGLEVTWSVNDAGSIKSANTLTDELGQASALWILGSELEHDGVARVAAGAASAFSAADAENRVLDLFEVGLVQPRTFDGSRQTVHPDFVRTPDDWGAY